MSNMRCPQCEAPYAPGTPSCDQCGFPLPEWVPAGSGPALAENGSTQKSHASVSASIPASPQSTSGIPIPDPERHESMEPVPSEPPAWEEPKIPLPDNSWHPIPSKKTSAPDLAVEKVLTKVDIPLPLPRIPEEKSPETQQPRAIHKPAVATHLSPEPTRWKLVVVEGFTVEKEYLIYKETMILGRRDVEQKNYPDIDLEDQDDGFISRKHAVIRIQDDSLMIEDFGGENGTFIDGQQLDPHQWVELKEGQVLRVGRVGLWVQRCPVRDQGERR